MAKKHRAPKELPNHNRIQRRTKSMPRPAEASPAARALYYQSSKVRCQTPSNDELSAIEETGTVSSLADRFHALPTELRAEIFSHIVVQPVKWDIQHRPSCSRLFNDCDITPQTCDYGCADGQYWSFWREALNKGKQANVSPWRSKWAPLQANPYLCTDCYYRSALRPGPHPRPGFLYCLCTRRQNLEVLLVCKRWYEEASLVFYTRNIFAFEDAFAFVCFVHNTNPKWRDIISRISIMSMSMSSDVSPNAVIINEDGDGYHRIKSMVPKEKMWTLLRSLPRLTYLELDHSFLTVPETVVSMRRLGLRNCRQVCFTRKLPYDLKWAQGTPTVWPQYAGRTLLKGGLAEIMARCIKGERKRLLNCKKDELEGLIDQFRDEIEGD